MIDGVIAYMKNPDITTAEMMQYIPGPDFPTGGIIANKDDLPAIYESGVGKIKIRGKIEIEKGKGGKDRMVITEIPYTMIGANIGKFLNDVYGLVESKATSDITDITNQSSKEGIRIVLELKKGRYRGSRESAVQENQAGRHLRCQYACSSGWQTGDDGCRADHPPSCEIPV